jgi:hypothetical protein
MVADDAPHRPAPPAGPLPPATPAGQADTAPTSDTVVGSESLSGRGTDLGFGEAAPPPAADALVGATIGGVVIEAVIAEGGMGRVYRGMQREPRRTVAVKVMRPVASRLAVARFQREVDVLARLRHPAIAQVYFAGTQRLGLDEVRYFVMEHVPEAKTIVAFADAHGLSPRERCELFLQACDAVAHGHAEGVVHRDLKPGNVLVDPAGRVKVIDFGVARLLDAESAGYTETGQFVGTRHAMSPEQFATDGRAVDARSDVYSLGVLLHQLLAGRLPYDIDETSLLATARIVEEAVPRRLEAADRSLRGLAVIADRCLAKRPADRYASAADLAADVRRVLAGDTPQTLPQSARARLGWWWRRRRGLVLIAGGMAISLLVMVAALTRGGDRAAKAGVSSTRPSTAALDRTGPVGRFANVSSGRTTPLDWVTLSFDEDVDGLTLECFRLTRDGQPVPLDGGQLSGSGRSWKVGGLAASTTAAGQYVLELVDTDAGPRDAAGNRLATPVRVAWRMPAREVFAFNLLGPEWERHVVALEGVERYTEQHAGATTFLRPTQAGVEGQAMLRFSVPFVIQDALLMATAGVWTTGDPFPYDPGARAVVEVSADGKSWTKLVVLEAGRGGADRVSRDISPVVAGGQEVWVRARLTGTREWPGDGLIYSQFLRTDPENPVPSFRLELVGPHPPVIPGFDD